VSFFPTPYIAFFRPKIFLRSRYFRAGVIYATLLILGLPEKNMNNTHNITNMRANGNNDFACEWSQRGIRLGESI